MEPPSIDAKSEIIAAAMENGFIRARILAKEGSDALALPERWAGGPVPAALVAALPYGNIDPAPETPDAGCLCPEATVRIDLFSRRNYYGEAVRRMQETAKRIRSRLGGNRQDYRVLCNSPVPEKPLAAACGLGAAGRNSLIITPEAGSLVVIAILTLPFPLPGDAALDENPCGACSACVDACPTGALRGDGTVSRERCIQWFLSRPGTMPEAVSEACGGRLYGCSICREACPHNAGKIPGTETALGALPECFDARELADATNETLRMRFKGTALGMSWFGPEAIRRNARLSLERRTHSGGQTPSAIP